MKSDQNPRTRKLHIITKGVVQSVGVLGLANYTTALKRMIPTASLVIPSPNTREKSLGCFSKLIKEMAATTSLEQSREHISKISMFES